MADSSTPSERMHLLPEERQLKKFVGRKRFLHRLAAGKVRFRHRSSGANNQRAKGARRTADEAGGGSL